MELTNKIQLSAVAFLIMMCVMLSGCNKIFPPQGSAQAGPQGMGPAMTPEVGIVVMKSEPVTLSTELPGRVSAFRVAEIKPQVSGLLQKRLFTEGSNVEAGQILYEIDPAPFQVELDTAEASLGVAMKTADRARAALAVSIAAVKQQQATLNFARKNRKRIEDLTQDGAVSLTERDQAVTQDEVSESAVHSAEAQVKSNQEAIAEAEATIKKAKAGIDAALINLKYTKIKAPISGRIGRSEITEGAIVTAYQPTPLATIQQMDPIYVDVPQSTNEISRLRQRVEKGHLNQDGSNQNKVNILLEDGSEYPEKGDLQFRDITVDQSTGSIIVRIVVPNKNNLLLPGMFLRAVVTEGVNEKAILVPQQAVAYDPKGNAYTYIVGTDNKVKLQTITTDRSFGANWLVTTGLKEGDRVIADGVQKVKPDMTVNPVPFDVNAKPKDAKPTAK